MKKKYRLLYKFLFLCLVIFFSIPLLNIYWYNTPDSINFKQSKDYAVVFGAAIRPKGELSHILKQRMDDAIYLYKHKKVKMLILSGALDKQMAPGEPKAMRLYALKKGVKKQDIILDERGDRTYLTVQYASYLSKRNPRSSFIFVSSPYHMFRIRFLVFMMHINHSYFYFKQYQDIPFYHKEVIREIFAFWFYFFYRIGYSFR